MYPQDRNISERLGAGVALTLALVALLLYTQNLPIAIALIAGYLMTLFVVDSFLRDSIDK